MGLKKKREDNQSFSRDEAKEDLMQDTLKSLGWEDSDGDNNDNSKLKGESAPNSTLRNKASREVLYRKE